MRRLFNIAIFALLTFLIAGRVAVHARTGDPGALSCEAGAARVMNDARAHGFSAMAAGGQAEAFQSRCMVVGQAPIGTELAYARN